MGYPLEFSEDDQAVKVETEQQACIASQKERIAANQQAAEAAEIGEPEPDSHRASNRNRSVD